MNSSISHSTSHVGYWSAVLCTLFSISYVVIQLMEWQGWLGSTGGPQSSSTAFGLFLLLTPSLLLAPAFLLLMTSINLCSAPEQRIWGQAAVAFATMYATLISIVYFVQLTLVAPRLLQQRTEGIEPFLFLPFDSFLYAVDLLGYSFMSAATLCAARTFTGAGRERTVRWWLTANGLLMPFIALQMYIHELLWIASLWAITFPASTLTLALLFHELQQQRAPAQGLANRA